MSTSITLPHDFDTTLPGRIILIGLWSTMPLLGISFFFVLTGSGLEEGQKTLFAALLPVITIGDMVIGYFLYQRNQGAHITLASHMVTITPDVFLGIRTKAREGTFPLTDYTGFTIRMMKKGCILKLVGKDSAHSQPLTSGTRSAMAELAQNLSQQTNLPVLEKT